MKDQQEEQQGPTFKLFLRDAKSVFFSDMLWYAYDIFCFCLKDAENVYDKMQEFEILC